MKILHIATRHRRGGAERNLADAVARAVRAGHDVTLVVGPEFISGDFPPDVQVRIYPRLVRPVSLFNDVIVTMQLRKWMRRCQFDVVHTHQSKAGVVGRFAARGLVAVIVHSIHMPSFGVGFSRTSSFVFRALERIVASFTDVYVAVGREVRDIYVQAGIGAPKGFLIVRSPVDLNRFASVRDKRAQSLREPGETILAAGTLDPRKRVDLILRAFARLCRELPTARLVVAGDGPARSSLEVLATELGIGGRVAFIGYRPNLDELLASADLFIHAAEVEGVPQVVLQALAAGVPVVAADGVGLREVPDAPVSIARRDVAALAEACVRTLSNPPSPVALSRLDPWSPQSLDVANDLLLRTVEDMVRVRRNEQVITELVATS